MNKIDKISKILNKFFNEKAEAKAVEKSSSRDIGK